MQGHARRFLARIVGIGAAFSIREGPPRIRCHRGETDMTVEPRPSTLCEAFQRTAAIDPGAVALRTPGGLQTLTWRAYATAVRQVAAGLVGLGVRHGDTVSLMMANRIEFYPLEVGA